MLRILLLQRLKKKRSSWVQPFLADRSKRGRFQTSFLDMLQSPQHFHQNFHMGIASFAAILKQISPRLLPVNNTRRDLVTPIERLAIVLEYLAHGGDAQRIASLHRISLASMLKFIDQVCGAVVAELKSGFMPFSEQNWLHIANQYHR